ncbi:hypothetical protein [Streptomyces sp. RTGN2]|uniref:hypothetical protein n=1 Tax=Streptomyces sp. RTGN2 TaxID=3016525 RepID=UPI002557C566|nr:hypothetical protein [Streptomyces sp. RTGN2]
MKGGSRRADGRRRRLYVPVLPVALLLLAVPAGLVACRRFRVSPAGALRGSRRLLWALPGTRFEIEEGRTALQVRIR